MPNSVATMLMFTGQSADALKLYASVFRTFEASTVDRWAAGEPGVEDSVKLARFRIAGHEFMCFDSPDQHAFTFTPSVSLFVECADEEELQSAFDQLGEHGQVLMAPGDYGFSRKFAWLNDRFGVSWQLNLS